MEELEDADEVEMMKHKPLCYYILNNEVVEERNAFFERPDQGIKDHLKILYIRARVEQTGLNKVLVDRGGAVNLIPQFMLKRIEMFVTNVKPHNMVLSNHEGNIGYTL